MKWTEALNDAIDYIEQNLDEQINYEEAAKKSIVL